MIPNNLLLNIAELGFKPGGECDPNKTLAQVVESHEQPLWEAFPSMLANAAEGGKFNFEAADAYLGENDKKFLKLLVLASLGLYDSLGRKFAWRNKLFAGFPARLIAGFADKLTRNCDLELGGLRIPAEKLRENFRLYFGYAAPRGPEAAISEIFTRKQAEIWFKKLRREDLTKTETEYFSRVIKKKIRALADEELHTMARSALK
jgi:hypothetical protein